MGIKANCPALNHGHVGDKTGAIKDTMQIWMTERQGQRFE